MPYTQLNPLATPGKRYSIGVKSPAGAFPRGSDLFTQLNVMALPGQRQSFSAKTAADDVGWPESYIYYIEEHECH